MVAGGGWAPQAVAIALLHNAVGIALDYDASRQVKRTIDVLFRGETALQVIEAQAFVMMLTA